MADFIKLLINKTDTLDGRRGTATPFKTVQLDLLKKKDKSNVKGQKGAAIEELIDQHIQRRVYMKYNVMKVR